MKPIFKHSKQPQTGCVCCGFLPPYIVRKLSLSDDPKVRRVAYDTLEAAAMARTRRENASAAVRGRPPLPGVGKKRFVYDMENTDYPLPGAIKRKGGQPATGDEEVDRVFDHAGVTYDFYKQIFERQSIDGANYPLSSSVRFGVEVANAFWDGQQMVYGSGDGHYFISFTRSLAISAHEITHGLLSFTSKLAYEDQSGALNESFCDVMAAAVEQWHLKQTVEDANWFIGAEVFGPALQGLRGVRSFSDELAYENHAILGTDIQPKHMSALVRATDDHGGVHVNSGIPNHAFYRVARMFGGKVWEKAARIWYDAFTTGLTDEATFEHAAAATETSARRLFGEGDAKVVAEAWRAVGVETGS
jgi:Zn-dependent metalloprotease